MNNTVAWLDPSEVMCSETGDMVELWEEMVIQAAWWLDALTGGVLHGPQSWEEDYDTSLCPCHINLRRGPVDEIVSVERIHRCGGTPTEIPWCLSGTARLDLCCVGESGSGAQYVTGMQRGCGCHGVVRVLYITASNLPPGTVGKVGWLAAELMKSYQGSGACALPERITSVTRQGMTWTLLDPGDYLDRGLIGVPAVDAWLMAVRRAHPNVKVIDPLCSNRVMTREGPVINPLAVS